MKSKVKQITFGFSENEHASKFLVGRVFKSFLEADQALMRCAMSAPEGGGYDKTDFRVEWENGEVYDGRFDLDHDHRVGGPLLEQQMRRHLEFYAGEHRPAHLTEQQAAVIRRRVGDEYAATSKRFLDTCNLEG